MSIQAKTFKFPKHCDQDLMLRMVIMLMNVFDIDVSNYPGYFPVAEEDLIRFSNMYPEFVVEYVNLQHFCRMMTTDNTVKLMNLTVSPAIGQGIISVELTPKPGFIKISGI